MHEEARAGAGLDAYRVSLSGPDTEIRLPPAIKAEVARELGISPDELDDPLGVS